MDDPVVEKMKRVADASESVPVMGISVGAAANAHNTALALFIMDYQMEGVTYIFTRSMIQDLIHDLHVLLPSLTYEVGGTTSFVEQGTMQ